MKQNRQHRDKVLRKKLARRVKRKQCKLKLIVEFKPQQIISQPQGFNRMAFTNHNMLARKPENVFNNTTDGFIRSAWKQNGNS